VRAGGGVALEWVRWWVNPFEAKERGGTHHRRCSTMVGHRLGDDTDEGPKERQMLELDLPPRYRAT
jgi:hypothetical protein